MYTGIVFFAAIHVPFFQVGSLLGSFVPCLAYHHYHVTLVQPHQKNYNEWTEKKSTKI